MANQSSPNTILALDVGSVRIGVAVASRTARLPRPLSIIPQEEQVFANVKALAETEEADLIVVGLPRNMNGLETKQSSDIRQFAKQLNEFSKLKVVFADESLSSRRAQEGTHGYKSTSGGKHLDDVAACLIMEEYFNQESTGQ